MRLRRRRAPRPLSNGRFEDTALAVPEAERDLDVPQATVAGFVRMGREFVVTLDGGPGHWIDATTGKDTSVTSSTLEFSLGIGLSAGADAPDQVCELLSTWQEQGTRVHVAAARGRRTVLAESPTRFVTIPR